MITSAKSRGAITGVLAAGATATGLLAGAALGSAPTANASCASFFGLGNSADCSSTPLSIAIAVGSGATAHASGLLGAAFAVGTNSAATTGDAFTLATALGDGSVATANGLFGIATQLGPNGSATTAGSGLLGNPGFNIALNVSALGAPTNSSTVTAGGTGAAGNIALNLFGRGTANDPGSMAVTSRRAAQHRVELGRPRQRHRGR